MTHLRFVFCHQMNRNVNDHQYIGNTQLLKAICNKAEQSTRSWLYLYESVERQLWKL